MERPGISRRLQTGAIAAVAALGLHLLLWLTIFNALVDQPSCRDVYGQWLLAMTLGVLAVALGVSLALPGRGSRVVSAAATLSLITVLAVPYALLVVFTFPVACPD